jgi:hypothetical protein
MNGGFSRDEGFPPRRRFPKLNEPLAHTAPTESIWPQIPLCGSLLVGIVPRTRDEFASVHGFEVADIERLVDFARDTGRIQFKLNADPLHYVGLDYLDPIFIELKPPAMMVLPHEALLEKNVLKEYEIEFYTLAEIDFIPKFARAVRHGIAGITSEYIEKRVLDYCSDYIVLKGLGYEDITNRLGDALVSDYGEAMRLFTIYGNFLAEPCLVARKMIFNRSLEQLQGALTEKTIQQEKISLPCEVGKFLVQKLSLFPESFQACLDVVSKYKEEELEKVFSALNEAVFDSNFDLMESKSEDLSAILENVWNDARKLFRTSTILRFGIPTDIAVMGAAIGMIGGPIGAAAGVLAGLGYEVAQETVRVGANPISDRIAKFGEPSYISSIFDFQKKVKLDK